MIAYGNKQDIEQLEYDIHQLHSRIESNYDCERWAMITQSQTDDDWMIDVGEIIDGVDLSKVTVTNVLPDKFKTNETNE